MDILLYASRHLTLRITLESCWSFPARGKLIPVMIVKIPCYLCRDFVDQTQWNDANLRLAGATRP